MNKIRLPMTGVLLLALLVPTASIGIGQADPGGPSPMLDRRSVQEAPLVPETLTWRQRTAEEWASAELRQTILAADGGVALAEAAFVLSDAGDFDDIHRYTTAIIPFDADGDGDLDLALGNEGPSAAVELLLNDGAGVFSAVHTGELGAIQSYHTTSLAAFDADRDGDLDLALGSSDETPNALFLNDGAGYFVLADAGDFGDTASFADTLLAFDADGDGDLDLACGSYASELYLNDGNGHFSRLTGGDFTDSRSPVLAALDADGDGDVDLAAPGRADPGIPGRLYRNDGAGNFTASPAGDFDNASGPALVAFDADGDGDLDLATPGQLYRSSGAGSFTLVDAGDFSSTGGDGRLLVALDADSDGDLDLAMARWNQPNAIYLNSGSGIFTQVDAGQFDDGNGYVMALAALDADGDGAADLAMARSPRTFLFGNQGGGRFDLVDAGDLSNEVRTTRAMAAFDANRDGVTDLAIAGTPNALFLSNGSGHFVRTEDDDYTEAGQVVALAPLDADGDGDIDLATANAVDHTGGAANRLLLNDGSGRLALADAGAFDDPALDTSAIVAFDADGDGDSDLAVGNLDAANGLYLNNGHGSFVQADAGGFDDPIRNTAALLAFDADRDGDQDLAVINEDAVREFYRNNGAGVFSLADAGSFDDLSRREGSLLACDVDGDGDLDLVVLDRSPGVYLNDGQGWFTLRGDNGLAGIREAAVAALDYDHDGDVDLAIGRQSGSPYLLLANDGTGRFSQAFGGDLATSHHGWAALVVLDVDRDGDLDLARPGQVLAYENFYEAGSVTSPVIDPAQLHPTSGHLLAWQGLTVQQDVPTGTELRYDILDAQTGDSIPGFGDLQPDDVGHLDLSGLSVAAYPAIRLRANLLDLHSGSDYLDSSPRLYEWSLTFTMTSEVPPPRTFDAFRAATPPSIDGSLADWPALPALQLDHTTAEIVRGIVPVPADSSAELRAQWTPNALYFAVHVLDDVIVNDSSAVWRDDEIELAIDGQHDLASGGPDDHQYTVNPDGRTTDGGIDPAAISVGVRTVSGGWDVEVRLPIYDLHTGPLYGDRRLGFSLGLHDDDDGGTWDSYMIWEGDDTYGGADGFGVLRLVDAYQPMTWQQHSYHSWLRDTLDQAALVGDGLTIADTGQFPAGTSDIAVVVPLDVDGDGDMDLAAGADGVNSLYENDGTGVYAHVEAGAFDDDAATTVSLVVLDVEGDGDLDLAESNDGTANAIFVNDGKGVFTRLTGGSFGSAGAMSVLVALDANGDGADDLAGPHLLYLNDGTGSFTLTPAGDYSADSWEHTMAIAAADLDGDGDADLAVGNAGGRVNPCWAGPNPGCSWEVDMLYLNNGLGQFTRSTGGDFSGSWSNPDHTVALLAFDADRDGDIDLLKGNQGWCWDLGYSPPDCNSEGEGLYLNDGTGSFSLAAWFGPGWTTDLAAGDVDGDGDADVIVANEPLGGGLPNGDGTPNRIYLNDGTGQFSPVESDALASAAAGRLASLDADGDGAADILLETTLYRSELAETACVALAYAGFARSEAVSFPGFQPLAILDADDDGDSDLVGSGQVGNTSLALLYLNDGLGNFHRVDAGQLDDVDQRTTVVAVFDADGDGDPDLATGNVDQQADALFLNDGTGVFVHAEAGAFDDPTENTSELVAFDADGDGDLDLAAGGPRPEALYVNDGTGVFALAASGDWADYSRALLDLVAFDADGDGDIDLLPATGEIYPYPTTLIYLNNGQGIYTAAAVGSLGQMPDVQDLATLDADGDGDTDVVYGSEGWYGGFPDGLALNDGEGHLGCCAGGLLNLNRATEDVAVLDADQDGDQDLVATSGHTWGYGTVLLLNDGAANYRLQEAGDFEGAVGNVLVLDADGDGDMDILGGALYLNENLYEQGTVTSPILSPQNLYPEGGALTGWYRLQVNQMQPALTDLAYDVLDPASGAVLPGFGGLRPDAAGQIDLSAITVHDHQAIQLRARLADQQPGPDWPDHTPALCGWQVSFHMEGGPEPTPTATPTYTPTASHTPTPTPTSTPSASLTGTATWTPTATATSTVLPSATLTPTATATATATVAPRRIWLPLVLQ